MYELEIIAQGTNWAICKDPIDNKIILEFFNDVSFQARVHKNGRGLSIYISEDFINELIKQKKQIRSKIKIEEK